jgi:hypothetical protein
MFIKDYEWYFKHLVEHLDMKESDLVIVESVAGWCREHGIKEKDEQKPVKLVSSSGTGRRMLVNGMIPDKVIEERINAARIRGQLKNIGSDWTEKLNSPTRKIAYFF